MAKLVMARFSIDTGRCAVERAEGETFVSQDELEQLVGSKAEFICRLSEFVDDLNDEVYPTESWVTWCFIENGNF